MVVADRFVKPLFLVGDSHTDALGGLLLKDGASGAPAAFAQSICVPGIRADEAIVGDDIHPGLVAALAGCILLANSPPPPTPELGIEYYGRLLGAHPWALTRDTLLMIGSADARDVLRSLPPGTEIELPFDADLTALPGDGIERVLPSGEAADLVMAHVRPLFRALEKLRDIGLPRLSLAALAPPTADDAAFFEKHEIRSCARVRYQVHLLVNAMMRTFCEEEGFGFVDSWDNVTERNVVKDGWLPDHEHLGREGAEATLLRFFELASKAPRRRKNRNDEDVWAFGDEAQRYGSAIPPGIRAIVADAASPDDCAAALAMAAERKKLDAAFYTAALVDDARSLVATRFAFALLQQIAGLDNLRNAFDQLAANALSINNQPQSAIPAYDATVLQTLGEVAQAGDAQLCRSWRERERLVRTLGRTRPYVVAMPGIEKLPDFERSQKCDAIVIWSPRVPGAAAALLGFALEELRFPAFIICADGAQMALRARSLRPDYAAQALERAALIVDASLSDPAGAIAWAARGLKVVASSTSGADEYLDGIETYDPWDWRSVFRAAVAGIGLPPPRARTARSYKEMLALTLEAAVPPKKSAGLWS